MAAVFRWVTALLSTKLMNMICQLALGTIHRIGRLNCISCRHTIIESGEALPSRRNCYAAEGTKEKAMSQSFGTGMILGAVIAVVLCVALAAMRGIASGVSD